MTKAKGSADKNLTNVVEALETEAVNSHHAQQLQQDKNDRRHQDSLNFDQPSDLEHQRN
ncbi:hypothetical protein L1N85_22705 [Paenibacillus alkaliterrae]|uniref:hypothetical protein n=1 Tax=Paenibacillus alkaliterrae TaxID=320909 RepID=UPI001F47A0F5|nr:hypothetical protein [Paenibacillus alkaliterrae]MCF2941185.1 hypothetical protein [Paenibacillus alkaliterrae]